MSAIGPKQTWRIALHMSAFGGKADMTVCRSPLSRSLLGVKQTWASAVHESAFDPKRTWALPTLLHHPIRCSGLTIGGDDETPRVLLSCRRYYRVATRSVGAAE